SQNDVNLPGPQRGRTAIVNHQGPTGERNRRKRNVESRHILGQHHAQIAGQRQPPETGKDPNAALSRHALRGQTGEGPECSRHRQQQGPSTVKAKRHPQEHTGKHRGLTGWKQAQPERGQRRQGQA
ncbi:hypothetical protein RZS08_53750, partial [Arthrospira platensis SPKY1]|nr:hypothetical protein [Arthrospira platensis SPKY1]